MYLPSSVMAALSQTNKSCNPTCSTDFFSSSTSHGAIPTGCRDLRLHPANRSRRMRVSTLAMAMATERSGESAERRCRAEFVLFFFPPRLNRCKTRESVEVQNEGRKVEWKICCVDAAPRGNWSALAKPRVRTLTAALLCECVCACVGAAELYRAAGEVPQAIKSIFHELQSCSRLLSLALKSRT